MSMFMSNIIMIEDSIMVEDLIHLPWYSPTVIAAKIMIGLLFSPIISSSTQYARSPQRVALIIVPLDRNKRNIIVNLY